MDGCASCFFARPMISDAEDEGPILKCHRHPPRLIVLNDDVVQARPDADDWCGEYRPSH